MTDHEPHAAPPITVPDRSWTAADHERAWEGHRKLASWRWEALRTTLWLVPTVLVVVAVVLFAVTFAIDWAAYYGHMTLPFWIRTETADAGRQVLIAIAAAVITVIGVVFSITILALTLASQQFGPRMMRNFVRDVGNQVTLGVFVATFVYSTLALGSIALTGSRGVFVPHLSIAVAEALLLVDVSVLIYFIHHIAKSIQLPEVIAGIARDLTREIDAEFPEQPRSGRRHVAGRRRDRPTSWPNLPGTSAAWSRRSTAATCSSSATHSWSRSPRGQTRSSALPTGPATSSRREGRSPRSGRPRPPRTSPRSSPRRT